MSAVRCFDCGRAHDPRTLLTVCSNCGLPLRVDYDFSGLRLTMADLRGREPTLWRYRELLPVPPGAEVSLAEGFTPLLPVEPNVWVKDESRNPTGSFKARGMALAVSMARHLGARSLTAPSAGNAAGALAAYAARAGLPATVAMPADTPQPFFDECELYGAAVHRVPGTISDAASFLRHHFSREPAGRRPFDVSTLREPYRIEGKKTMAYELVEQLQGRVPDVVLYPTGGGTGLIGMHKAFAEMGALGWIAPGSCPRFVSVQATGCAPVVKAFTAGELRTQPWADPRTTAYGLRVPAPLGGFLCLRVLRASHGAAIAIDDADSQRGARELAARAGIDVCPEGGAAWAAHRRLRASGVIGPQDTVVVFNTGAGVKYR